MENIHQTASVVYCTATTTLKDVDVWFNFWGKCSIFHRKDSSKTLELHFLPSLQEIINNNINSRFPFFVIRLFEKRILFGFYYDNPANIVFIGRDLRVEWIIKNTAIHVEVSSTKLNRWPHCWENCWEKQKIEFPCRIFMSDPGNYLLITWNTFPVHWLFNTSIY